MTFVEIESRRRPCWFLSNNVEKLRQRGFLLLVSLVMSQIEPRRGGEPKKKKNLHLIKHTIVHRWQAGEDIIMTITVAIKNRRAAGRESVVQNKSKEPECNISGFRADHRPFTYQSRVP